MLDKMKGLGGLFGQKIDHPLANPRELKQTLDALPKDNAFKALDEMGYARYCSVEFESFYYHDRVLHGNTEEAARISRAQIRELLCPVYDGMGL